MYVYVAPGHPKTKWDSKSEVRDDEIQDPRNDRSWSRTNDDMGKANGVGRLTRHGPGLANCTNYGENLKPRFIISLSLNLKPDIDPH